jgi:hypothetical protein
MNSYRSEKSIGAAFVRKVKERGFIAIKLSTYGMFGKAGWPDYLILGPDRWVSFIELKTQVGRVTPLQQARMDTLRQLGFLVYVARSVAEALELGLPK